MAQKLGQVSEGTIVKINENGSPVDFYVAKHDYESSLNGAGRTLVVRKDTYDDRVWDSGNVNAYASSDLDSWFNSTYKNKLDADIRSLIGTTKIRYTPGNGNWTVGTLERAVFALSATELGQSHTYVNTEGSALPIASTLRIAYRNGRATTQWTRSPHTHDTNNAWSLYSNGNIINYYCTNPNGSRPAFTLPSTLYVSDDGNVYANSAPTAPANITVPESGNKGGNVAVSWSASTDQDGNLIGYTLQRSVNGGGFTQVYQGASTSYTDTAPTNADTLQYRVQAYDAAGATSGWTTSDQFPVYGVPTLTVPPMVMRGQQATISWSAIEGADSYTLQRKANTDTDWTQVYSGTALTYSETVGTWTSLQYRVCAVFGETSGGWATSDPIQIVSASALVISGQDGDLGTLVNDVPFSISSDQTGVAISATVEVNGGEYDAFTATSGQTYKVNVLDLPTGTGSIVITASATVSDSPITVTRTWTYSKTAQTFPNAGSVAELAQQGAVIWPKTLDEAVRASMNPWGGNLGTALELLKRATLYNRTQTPKYSEVTISMANVTEGQIVNIPRGGVMTPHYVAKLDYESGLNGTGRILFVPTINSGSRVWNSSGVNTYANSDLDTWLNGDYKNLYPADVQAAMGTTKFYYTPGNTDMSVKTLERAVFTPSCTEFGRTNQSINTEGSQISLLSQLITSGTGLWTRSPRTSNTSQAVLLNAPDYTGSTSCTSSHLIYPCFTLPSTFTGTYFVDQQGGIHDSQEYEEAGTWSDVWGNEIPAVKIATGSYVGTGTTGESNPTKISFLSQVKAIFIQLETSDPTTESIVNGTILGTGYVYMIPISGNVPSRNILVTEFSSTVSFYSPTGGAGSQFNSQGKIYRYLALL